MEFCEECLEVLENKLLRDITVAKYSRRGLVFEMSSRAGVVRCLSYMFGFVWQLRLSAVGKFWNIKRINWFIFIFLWPQLVK